MNSVRNGSRICRLILGNWPSALGRVQRYTRKYRQVLEQEVAAKHDSVDIMAAHWIDAACQHEATRQVCRWVLRERWEDLEPADVERNARAMADATDKRNAAVGRLNLTAVRDPWCVIDQATDLKQLTAETEEGNGGNHACDSPRMPTGDEGDIHDSNGSESPTRSTEHPRND